MSYWKVMKNRQYGEIKIVAKERVDSRNHHGSTEYLIEAFFDGTLVHSERHRQSVWLGHCWGHLLMPDVAERARNKVPALPGDN